MNRTFSLKNWKKQSTLRLQFYNIQFSTYFTYLVFGSPASQIKMALHIIFGCQSKRTWYYLILNYSSKYYNFVSKIIKLNTVYCLVL